MRPINWKINLAALWFAQTLIMIAFSFVFPFISLYVKSMGVEDDTSAAQWAGVIIAAGAVAMTVAQPFWGTLSDRFGRKPMMVRSMFGASLSVFLMGVVTGPEQLVVVRIIQGLIAGTVGASTALVATSTPKEKVGFALGTLQMGFFVGSSIGPLLGGYLADTLGFRPVFFVAAAMQLVGALMVTLFVKENFTKPAADAPKKNVWTENRSIMAISLFPTLLVVIFLIQFGGVIVSPILSLFIEQLGGSSTDAATAAGLVIAATGLVSALSAMALGRVSDRIGHRLLLPLCLIGATVSYFPQAYVTEIWQLLVLRMVLGAFLGGLMPSANALVAGIVPHERRGAAFGLTNGAQAFSNVAGPLLATLVVSFADMRTLFTIAGFLFLVGWLWVVVGFRRYKGWETATTPEVITFAQQNDLADGHEAMLARFDQEPGEKL